MADIVYRIKFIKYQLNIYIFINLSTYKMKTTPLGNTIEEALKRYDNKEITTDELSAIVKEEGGNISFWNREKDRHPAYPKGDNRSRTGFLFDPYHHEKGKFFQGVIKKVLLGAISLAHKWFTQYYDSDIFVYDDPRLNALNDFLQTYMDMHFADKYTHDFMPKVVDITLGLMKEDIRYRARFLDLLTQLGKMYPDGFPLSENEKENIKRW